MPFSKLNEISLYFSYCHFNPSINHQNDIKFPLTLTSD